MKTTDEHRTYHVVVNDAGQYSIWADGRDVPEGWHVEGVAGTKRECLDHITRLWVDGHTGRKHPIFGEVAGWRSRMRRSRRSKR